MIILGSHTRCTKLATTIILNSRIKDRFEAHFSQLRYRFVLDIKDAHLVKVDRLAVAGEYKRLRWCQLCHVLRVALGVEINLI